MKKAKHRILLCITGLFAVFLIGLFIGRSFINNSLYPYRIADKNNASASQSTDELAWLSQPYINGKMNLNAAPVEDLAQLPDIGEVLAQRIVEYRQENGPFLSIADLSLIEGFGENRIRGIIDFVTVGNVTVGG